MLHKEKKFTAHIALFSFTRQEVNERENQLNVKYWDSVSEITFHINKFLPDSGVQSIKAVPILGKTTNHKEKLNITEK